MEKIQRDFVRLVYKRSPNFHQRPENDIPYGDLLTKYNLELLELRRLKICLAVFHNYHLGLLPIDPTQAFQLLLSITRGDSHKLVCKPYTKDVRCNAFFPRISKIYSQLPPTLRNNPPNAFSTLLNTIDLSPFLTIKETSFRNF